MRHERDTRFESTRYVPTSAFERHDAGNAIEPGVATAELLTPEVVRPAQFDEIWQRRITRPSRRLAMAVLAQAMEDLQKYSHARRPPAQRLYQSACRWVVSRDQDWPFSFLNLCELLDLSPQSLRRRLLGGAAALTASVPPRPARVKKKKRPTRRAIARRSASMPLVG